MKNIGNGTTLFSNRLKRYLLIYFEIYSEYNVYGLHSNNFLIDIFSCQLFKKFILSLDIVARVICSIYGTMSDYQITTFTLPRTIVFQKRYKFIVYVVQYISLCKICCAVTLVCIRLILLRIE